MLNDLRFALRMLRRSPGFALVAVLSLAFPIGAMAAAISALYAVLLRPLPFEKPEQLAVIWQVKASEGWQKYEVPQGTYLDWKQRTKTFAQLAVLNPFSSVTLTGSGEPERLEGARVSANYFELLGRRARLGRTFLEGEDTVGRDRVAVISDRLWRRRFGADPQAVGRTAVFDGQEHLIAGVLPADFPVRAATPDVETSKRDVEVWRPLVLTNPQQRDHGALRVLGRLKPAAALAAANEEMNAIAADLAALYPITNRGWGAQVVPIAEQTVGEMSQTIKLSAGAVALMLLLACVSVAGLLLARATARRRELATRVALGASAGRVIRQLLTESVLLAGVGGALGVAFAFAALPALRELEFVNLPRKDEIVMHLPALLLSLGTILLTGIVSGLAPVIRVSRQLKGGVSRNRQFLSNTLVTIQVAISCVLLVGTGLLLRTVSNLQDVSPGFDPRGLLTLQITLPNVYYPQPKERVGIFRRMEEKFRQIPGVTAVGSSTSVPFMKRSDQAQIPYFVNGVVVAGGRMAAANAASPSYFEAMKIPLQGGRLFTTNDDRQSAPVIVVNAALAAQAWPGQDPVGQRISIEADEKRNRLWRQVIGVVGSVRPFGLDSPEQPTFYIPHAQFEVGWQLFAVRSSQAPSALAAAVRAAVTSLDPRQPIHNVATMQSMIGASLETRKAVLGLLSVLGVIALIVAGIGVYGLLSYYVQQSRKEIGIRSALGASAASILRLVLSRGIGLTTAGVVTGLIAALAGGRLLGSLLFGVTHADPSVYLFCTAALLVVSAIACAIPSWRALRVNASAELRRE